MCTSHQMTRFLLAYIQTIWNMAHTGRCTTATCILHVTGTPLLLRMYIVLWFMTRTKRPWIFPFCCLFACKAGAKCFGLRTKYTFAWKISGRTCAFYPCGKHVESMWKGKQTPTTMSDGLSVFDVSVVPNSLCHGRTLLILGANLGGKQIWSRKKACGIEKALYFQCSEHISHFFGGFFKFSFGWESK